uniref:Uncharacterized protein n=1 Tax=viral metagenome TaxID=1070528 RepID=A0A6C0EIK1_9ZZZZ
MDKFFFSFLNLTYSQIEINKIKKTQYLIQKESVLKNMITNHIEKYLIIDKEDVEDYDEHIKNTYMDLRNISSYMQEINIILNERDLEYQIRNYCRMKDLKRAQFLINKRTDLEQRFNVIFLLKKTKLFIRNDEVYINESRINDYGSIVVSKNIYELDLDKIQFAFVRNNINDKFVTILEGEVSKEINDYENKQEKYEIPKQNLTFYSGKIKFTFEHNFNKISFIIEGSDIKHGYTKFIFSTDKVL